MKTVICFGTFDKLHLGHLSYLKQAKKYGQKLVVVVARDINVKKIKGKLPKEKEKLRFEKVRKLNFVDQVALGQIKDRFKIIKKIKPDIIALGYDQPADLIRLKKIFKGKIIRLRPYKKHRYKSSMLNRY